MTEEDWQYLAKRLESYGGSLVDAAHFVRSMLAEDNEAMERPDRIYSVCKMVWHFVTGALDHETFELVHKSAVYALEAEMAGRVFSYRLQMGWLIRSPNAPENH